MNLIDDDEGGPVEDLNLARQPVRIARMTEELLLVGEIHVQRGR